MIHDEKYEETEHYWKTGMLSTVFQSYLDVNEILEKCELTEEEKVIEKKKVLEARKFAFGTDYIYVPPWKSRKYLLILSFFLQTVSSGCSCSVRT